MQAEEKQDKWDLGWSSNAPLPSGLGLPPPRQRQSEVEAREAVAAAAASRARLSDDRISWSDMESHRTTSKMRTTASGSVASAESSGRRRTSIGALNRLMRRSSFAREPMESSSVESELIGVPIASAADMAREAAERRFSFWASTVPGARREPPAFVPYDRHAERQSMSEEDLRRRRDRFGTALAIAERSNRGLDRPGRERAHVNEVDEDEERRQLKQQQARSSQRVDELAHELRGHPSRSSESHWGSDRGSAVRLSSGLEPVDRVDGGWGGVSGRTWDEMDHEAQPLPPPPRMPTRRKTFTSPHGLHQATLLAEDDADA